MNYRSVTHKTGGQTDKERVAVGVEEARKEERREGGWVWLRKGGIEVGMG